MTMHMAKKKQLDEQMDRLMSTGNTREVVGKHSLLMDVAVQIHLLRTKKGWSQRKLAREMGLPQSTVARVESGEFGVGLNTISKFLKALNAELKIVSKL